MLIDWFTVGAQALNFVILVWLMKRFLYKPILHAIDSREKRIAAEVAEADSKKAEAQEERTEFQHKNQELDQERATLLSQAADEANTERDRLLAEAREAAEILSAKQQRRQADEARDLSRTIGRRAREEVFAIARRALTDLATTSLEERMTEVFTRRLREMDTQAKARFGAAVQSESDPAIVRSAFELPMAQRKSIQEAINEAFSDEVHVRFETESDLIAGIELATNGQKVAWSIDEYLRSLEKSVAALVSKQAEPVREIKPDAPPVLNGGPDGHRA